MHIERIKGEKMLNDLKNEIKELMLGPVYEIVSETRICKRIEEIVTRLYCNKRRKF